MVERGCKGTRLVERAHLGERMLKQPCNTGIHASMVPSYAHIPGPIPHENPTPPTMDQEGH